MSAVIDGTDAIEAQQLILTASDRLAELLHEPYDQGTVQVCMALIDLAGHIHPAPVNTNKGEA